MTILLYTDFPPFELSQIKDTDVVRLKVAQAGLWQVLSW